MSMKPVSPPLAGSSTEYSSAADGVISWYDMSVCHTASP